MAKCEIASKKADASIEISNSLGNENLGVTMINPSNEITHEAGVIRLEKEGSKSQPTLTTCKEK